MVFALKFLYRYIFYEEATFSSLLIRPSTKALHKLCSRQFDIGLNWQTNYKAGLTQGIDLKVRS